MSGKEIAERLWGMFKDKGYNVQDGQWNTCDERTKAVWEQFASSLGRLNVEDVTQDVLRWEKDDRQKLYELLYNSGCRIR